MTNESGKCSDEGTDDCCESCSKKVQFLYWCEVCEKPVEEKRCPSCGLKTRKIR